MHHKPSNRAITVVACLVMTLTACAPSLKPQTIDRALAANSPIVITRLVALRPNSAGGIDVDIDAVNVGDRTIKYIVYTVELFNAVGDVVEDEIRDRSTARLRDTGPYRPGDGAQWGSWPTVFYNYSGRCVEITSVEVTFADDSTQIIRGPALAASMKWPDMNDCNIAL